MSDKMKALIANWLERADQIDDGSGVTLCANIAQHYRNRVTELQTTLDELEQPVVAKGKLCGNRFYAQGSQELGIKADWVGEPCVFPIGHQGQHSDGKVKAQESKGGAQVSTDELIKLFTETWYPGGTEGWVKATKVADRLNALLRSKAAPPSAGAQREYKHFAVCNGDRSYPAGEPGHSCSCFNSIHAADAAGARLSAALLEGLINQVLMGYGAGLTRDRIQAICEKWLASGDAGKGEVRERVERLLADFERTVRLEELTKMPYLGRFEEWKKERIATLEGK